MSSAFKPHEIREQSEYRPEEEVTTTVLPPIITTSYTSPLAYPIYAQPQKEVRAKAFFDSNPKAYQPPPQTASRIEYVPFQRKRKGYETKQIIEKVPVQKTIIDYQPVKKINYVPRERVITDYYVIEHQTAYIPRNIEEKVIDYVPVEKYSQRIQYKPVEKQIIHYPNDFDPVTGASVPVSQHPSVVTGSYVSRAQGIPVSIGRSDVKANNVVVVEKSSQPEKNREIVNQKQERDLQAIQNFDDDIDKEDEHPENLKKNESPNPQSKEIMESLKSQNASNFVRQNVGSSSQNYNSPLANLKSSPPIGSSLNYSPGSLPPIGTVPLGYREPQISASNPSFISGPFGYFAQPNYPQMAFTPGFPQAVNISGSGNFSPSNKSSFNGPPLVQPNLLASNESLGFTNIPGFVDNYPPGLQGVPMGMPVHNVTTSIIGLPPGYSSPRVFGPPYAGVPVHNQYGTFTTYLSGHYPQPTNMIPQAQPQAHRQLFSNSKQREDESDEDNQEYSSEEENSGSLSEGTESEEERDNSGLN